MVEKQLRFAAVAHPRLREPVAPATMWQEGLSGHPVAVRCATARPEHVGSMAASSADDHLTVGGDADVVVGADPEHAGMYLLRLRLSSDC